MAHASRRPQRAIAATQADYETSRADAGVGSRPRRSVIYLDPSVFLARIFAEDSTPSDTFWDLRLASSRLLLYEIWTRIYRGGVTTSWSSDAEALLKRVELIELSPAVLERALHPFPISLR